MKSIYSIGVTLNGGGIGKTAYYGAEGIYRNKALDFIIASNYKKAKISDRKVKKIYLNCLIEPPLGFIKNRIFSWFPKYTITNNAFDFLASFLIKKTDIFHGWMGMSLMQLRKAKRLGAKTIIECASSHPVNQRKLLLEEYNKFKVPFKLGDELIYKKSLKEIKEADYIKIPSDFVKKTFIEQGVPSEKLIKIPFGVNLDEFNIKKEIHDEFRAIFVGSIEMRKGIIYLLKAWDELKLKNAKLFVVGGIANDARCIIKKYKNRKDVIFTGHTDPRFYLKKSDIFVFPSIEEGSALVVYEAMACGLPCIVSSNSGSIVRDGKDGYILQIRDIDSLKEKILYFYNNREDIIKMGKNAITQVKKYNWEKHGDELYKQYRRIMNK